jgi:iron complex outermembrane receptor protein
VLKGPQGTLFGRNVTGGAVSVITSTPPDAFKGSFEATAGSYGQSELQGVIGGPLSDSMAGQIALSGKTSDGFYTNTVDGKDVDAQDTFGVRGKLRYDLNDAVRLVLSAEHARDKVHGVAFDQEGDPLPYMGTEAFGPDDEVTLNLPGGVDSETWAYTGTLTADTSLGTITSITAYRESENHSTYDADGTPVVQLDLFVQRTCACGERCLKTEQRATGSQILLCPGSTCPSCMGRLNQNPSYGSPCVLEAARCMTGSM